MSNAGQELSTSSSPMAKQPPNEGPGDQDVSPTDAAASERSPLDFISLNNSEDPIVCCSCDGAFDTDLSLVKSPTHRLPITCRECFNCTCCFQCLLECSQQVSGADATTEVTCPDCMKIGFDVKQVFPDRNLCFLLLAVRKLVGERNAEAASANEPRVEPKYKVGQKLKKVSLGGKCLYFVVQSL